MVVMAVIAVMATSLSALGHDATEMAIWEQTWETRVADQGGMTPELLAEWREFQVRQVVVQGQVAGDVPPGWAGLILAHFPASELDTALRVVACESGGDKGARNPVTGAAGLFQIMPFWAPAYGVAYEDLFAAEVNVAVARWVWDQQGWRAWSCW